VKPQVLVLDLMMPVMSGRDVIGQVVQRFPSTRVVVLSMHASEAYVLDALRSGALAYVLKESSAQDLVAAVRAAAAGRRYLGSGLSEHAIAAYVERTKGAPLDPYDTLTPREREVLRLTAEGESSAAIAARLAISPRTVETHRANLMRKLGLRAHGDVIRYALKRKIVPLE
jgi:DNA-binding NarL/FixJ family response regulator